LQSFDLSVALGFGNKLLGECSAAAHVIGDLGSKSAKAIAEGRRDVAVVTVAPRTAPAMSTVMGSPVELQATP